MFCPKCGVDNDDNAYRCTKCATIIQTVAAPPAVVESGNDALMRAILPVGRSGYAIAAGYLGLVSLLVLPGPLAVCFSILAIRDIKKNPAKHGMGRAIFGLVMGGFATAILLSILYSNMSH